MKEWVAAAVLIAAVALGGACAPPADGEEAAQQPMEGEMVQEHADNVIRVVIAGNELIFPDKDDNLPRAIRDDPNSVSLRYQFTLRDPGFSEIGFGDFGVYAKVDDEPYPQWRKVAGSGERIALDQREMRSGGEVVKETRIGDLPDPPGPLLLESTVTITTAGGQVSIIDPPPVIIYP